MNIVLLSPETPYNIGNIGRTCVLTNSVLHLIRPFKIVLDDKKIKRAGMDYWPLLKLKVWDSYEIFIEKNPNINLFFATTKTKNKYTDVHYGSDDYIMFGPESCGIPESILNAHSKNCITIPMIHMGRSLNLSNSAAIILYEALRQQSFSTLL